MDWGEKIQLAREAAKYTQAESAAISGIAKRTIQNNEHGEHIHSVNCRHLVSAVYGV